MTFASTGSIATPRRGELGGSAVAPLPPIGVQVAPPAVVIRSEEGMEMKARAPLAASGSASIAPTRPGGIPLEILFHTPPPFVVRHIVAWSVPQVMTRSGEPTSELPT